MAEDLGAEAFEHHAVAADGSVVVCGLHRLFDVSSEPMCVASFDGELLRVNPAWTQVLGWHLEQLLGRAYLDFVHPDDVAATVDATAGLTRGESVTGFDNRYRHREGGYRWLRWSSVPVVSERRVYAVVRDVTEERHRQDRLAELERVSGIGAWTLDLDSGATDWSAGVHAIYGTDPQTFRPGVDDGMRCYPPASRAVLEPAFTRLVEHGEPYDLELAFTTMQGEPRWIRTTGRAALREGTVIGVSGSFQDITANREREAALRETSAALERAQELARLGPWEIDIATEQVQLSGIVSEILGWEPEGVTVSLDQLRAQVHPEDRERFDDAVSRTQREGAAELVHRVLGHDAETRTIQVRARAIPDPTGVVTRLAGTVQDITDLATLTDALRDSEARLHRVLAATNDGWWDADLRTGDTFESDRLAELHGYGPGGLPSDPAERGFLVHPEDRDVFLQAYVAAVDQQRRTFEVATRARRRDGSSIHVRIKTLVEYDADGNPVRMSGATTDVTEQRRAEALKEAFVSNVSHELRTPLTAIGGALELLERGAAGELSPAVMQLVDVALRNNVRLRRLIDDLLDVERLATGQTALERRSQPLGPLLERALEELAPYGLQRGVSFALTRQAEAVVEVDGDRLAQVLANLLSNAAKFAPEGSQVELRLHRSVDRARVEVIDRGPGVPPAFRDQVFERFSQAEAAGDRSRGGTGLGLAISRAIIEQQGGTIGFESEPGRTCFWFELPVVG